MRGEDADDEPSLDDEEIRVRWAEGMLAGFKADAEKKLSASAWASLAAGLGSIPVMRRAISRWERSDNRNAGWVKWVFRMTVCLAFFYLLFLPDGGVLRYYGIFVPTSYGVFDLTRTNLERRDIPFLDGEVITKRYERFRKDVENLHDQIASEPVDPDNSWYDYADAASLIGNSYSPSGALSGAVYELAYEKVRNARGKPYFDSLRNQYHRRYFVIMPQDDYDDFLNNISSLGRGRSSGFSPLSRMLAERAERCGKSGDVQGFREVRDDSLLFLRAMISDRSFTTDYESDLRFCLRGLVTALDTASKVLGVEVERPEIARWNEVVLSRWNSYYGPDMGADAARVDEMILERGSMDYFGHHFQMVSLAYLEKPPRELHPDELKPGRMRDYTGYSAKLCWLAFLITLGAVIAGNMYHWRIAEVPRLLGQRLLSLLGVVDWLWIIGAGVLLPFGVMGAIFWLTPFGGNEYSLRVWLMHHPVLAPTGIHTAALLLMLMLPVLIARWRLAVRVDGAGVSKKSSIGWLMAGLVFLSVFTFTKSWSKWYGLIGLDFGLLWLVVTAGGALLLVRRHPVPTFAISRAILPAFVFGALLWLSVFRATPWIQDYWFSQDRFIRFDPEKPDVIPYNYEIAKQLRKELRETLGE